MAAKTLLTEMCGIAGTLNLTQDHPIDELRLREMLDTIRHRGPDQLGTYVYQDDISGVGLASARLSIIDIAGGQQPISNETGTIWIVFNGEIYNYIELRDTLEELGHHLATESDTEVIVHLYEQYGRDCVRLLNGQFAFALWDELAHTLFIARDRLGIRPLYYCQRDGALIFASEIKALLADPRVSAALDPLALHEIFTLWSPIPPRTPFKDIVSLAPGHTLLVKSAGQLEIEPYWKIDFPAETISPGPRITLDEATHELRRLLLEATQLRLRADVPVGAYLSGGLDSSTIAAIIRGHTSNRLETFSIAFSDDAFDESSFQLQMAEQLGTRHHIITCTHEDIGRSFPEVIWHTESPIMRTSPVPLFLLSKLVREHGFKVVLTGEGADEFLAGYNIFKEDKIRRYWARKPDSVQRASLLRLLYPYIGSLASSGSAFQQKFFRHRLTETEAWDYSHALRWRTAGRSTRFFSHALRDSIGDESTDKVAEALQTKLPEEYALWPSLSRAQYLEITLFLQGYLLSSQGDRVAMAHSVEGRFPFLDHRLVEFCNGLPPRFKLKGLDEKYLLKRTMRGALPDEILRRAKRPYRAPVHRSFFPDGRPLDWVAEMLSSRRLKEAGLFDSQAVAYLTNKLERTGNLGEGDDMALAGILSTQLLHYRFVDEFRPVSPAQYVGEMKRVVRDARPFVEHSTSTAG